MAAAKKSTKRRKLVKLELPETKFFLFDSKGELFNDYYESHDDAHYDAVGPRFHRGFYVVEAKVTKVSQTRYDYQDPVKPKFRPKAST